MQRAAEQRRALIEIDLAIAACEEENKKWQLPSLFEPPIRVLRTTRLLVEDHWPLTGSERENILWGVFAARNFDSRDFDAIRGRLIVLANKLKGKTPWY